MLRRPTHLLALAPLFALFACNGSWSGFQGSYSGSLTENYMCDSAASPAPFLLGGQTVSINVDGDGNAVVTFGACSNQSLTGIQTGDTIVLQESSTITCVQSDPQGDTLSVFNLGGSINYQGTSLNLNLTENATINGGATCSGTGTGLLGWVQGNAL